MFVESEAQQFNLARNSIGCGEREDRDGQSDLLRGQMPTSCKELEQPSSGNRRCSHFEQLSATRGEGERHMARRWFTLDEPIAEAGPK